MSTFKLIRHSVTTASFAVNNEREKKSNTDVSIEGGILIPRDLTKSNDLLVQLKITIGSSDEYLYLTLKTETRFEFSKEIDRNELSEESVRKSCFPVALKELRKSVQKVTEAYGISPLELPPFEEEAEYI